MFRVHALSPQDELKQQAAWKAVEYVSSGMKLGLGTGSTAAFAVERVGDLLAKGELKDIVAVPTSIKTFEQAQSAPGTRRATAVAASCCETELLVLSCTARRSGHPPRHAG